MRQVGTHSLTFVHSYGMHIIVHVLTHTHPHTLTPYPLHITLYTTHTPIRIQCRTSGNHTKDRQTVSLYYHLRPGQVFFVGLDRRNDTPEFTFNPGVSSLSLAEYFHTKSDGEPLAFLVLLVNHPSYPGRTRATVTKIGTSFL